MASKQSKAKKRGTKDDKVKVDDKKIKSGETQGTLMSKAESLRRECAQSVAKFTFNKKRVRVLSDVTDMPAENEGILYWMYRDQRVQDNWALLYAQRLALKQEVPLHVCFCLDPSDLHPLRHHSFMLNGLRQVQKELSELDIPFHLLDGDVPECLAKFVDHNDLGGLVTDFSPLRGPREWVEEVAAAIPDNIPFCQVDAHNIVPCWVVTDKLEYAARTMRPKVHKHLDTFMTEFPPVTKHPHKAKVEPQLIDWESAMNYPKLDRSVSEVDWAHPGTDTAFSMLETFITETLKVYSSERNDPTKDAVSNMSPWLHFGQISAQRCALVVSQYKNKYKVSVEGFIEELVVRKELAENFCFFNEKYDTIEGTNDWAKKTLEDHAKDKRQYEYTREQFEKGQTHEDLWNAAQTQLVLEGKMHGFLRMYWAKKILEWSSSPQEALETALYLNDRYSLDGTDPNGYVGCMWSICGIHDQGWKERDIFGKIRYMNYAGCKRKFDVDLFVRRYEGKMV